MNDATPPGPSVPRPPGPPAPDEGVPPPGRLFPPAGPVRRPDPGSRRVAAVCGVLVVVLIGLVATLQQTLPSRAARAVGQQVPLVEPAPFEFEFTAKMLVKLSEFWGKAAGVNARELDAQAASPAQQLRVAIVDAELSGPDSALARLDLVEPVLPEDSPLLADVDALRRLYSEGEAAVGRAELDRLEAHHGWFGRLAAVYGRPPADPDRAAVAGGGGALTAVLLLVAAVVCVLIVAGLVLFVVGVSFFASGRLPTHFVPPLPGGSVAIETVAVFVAGFIALKLAAWGVEWVAGEAAAAIIGLFGQWALLAAILWPLARGVPLRQMMAMFGLHRGRGFWREAGAGVVGYVACIPFLLLGIGISLFLLFLQSFLRSVRGQAPAAAPENPILEIVAGGQNFAAVVLFMLLAALWAPLAEETIFRGALYRHLRSRLPWAPAAFVTALGFGLMHGYPLILLGPVIGLGFGFSLLREWRGSLIGPMVGHCLHNAAVVSLLVALGRLVA